MRYFFFQFFPSRSEYFGIRDTIRKLRGIKPRGECAEFCIMSPKAGADSPTKLVAILIISYVSTKDCVEILPAPQKRRRSWRSTRLCCQSLLTLFFERMRGQLMSEVSYVSPRECPPHRVRPAPVVTTSASMLL